MPTPETFVHVTSVRGQDHTSFQRKDFHVIHITVFFHGTHDLSATHQVELTATKDEIDLDERIYFWMTKLGCACFESEGFSDFRVCVFIWVCVSKVS